MYTAKSNHKLRIATSMVEEILDRETKKHEEEVQRQQKEKSEEEELVKKVRDSRDSFPLYTRFSMSLAVARLVP